MEIYESKRQHLQEHSEKYARTPSPDTILGPPLSSERAARTPPPHRVGPPPSPPVPTSPVTPFPPQPEGPLSLQPCLVCGRTFVLASLAKHVKICEKTATKKRKTFDSSRQRREGTDLEQYLPKNFGLPENSPFLEKSPPPTAKPAPKHKAQTVRNVVTKPVTELQKCPHCCRAFGVRAFERHVEWCADKAKILPSAPAQPPAHIADAKQRLNARTQYKAPPVRGRRSSQTRDKSSNSRSASVESSRGVSPPLAPRDSGDYRHGRTRASVSESVSSNEYQEDTSHHVPVIRNTRASHNHTGDTVKARQARLARDLNNSNAVPSSKPPLIQETNIDPNLKKTTMKNKMSKKKQQQLKNLEMIAQKFNERQQNKISKTENKTNNSVNNDKHRTEKSLIPVSKQLIEKQENNAPESSVISSRHLKTNLKNTKISSQTTSSKKIKNNHVENIVLKSNNQNSKINQNSIGINTDLLCPCVPCSIHKNTKDNITKHESKKERNVKKEYEIQPQENTLSETEIKILYKNPTMVSARDINVKDIVIEQNADDNNGALNTSSVVFSSITTVKSEDLIPGELLKSDSNDDCKLNEINDNLSREILDEVNENDAYEENEDDSLQDKYLDSNTYTKYMDNPADLEEFINITDQLIRDDDCKEIEYKDDNNICIDLCTPNTNSLELVQNVSDNEISDKQHQHKFSDSFTEVKNNLLQILQDSNITIESKDTWCDKIAENNNAKKLVSNMEHITIYEIEDNENEAEESTLRLPSITENNKPIMKEMCTTKRLHGVYKYNSNDKYKMLRELKKGDKVFQTFTLNENDDSSVYSDAPPMKLPRIQNKRNDDVYDPFLSAARQMKQLMSSETNIPKKLQLINKDPNRTLPSLRPTKEKSPFYARSDNTKMMKDTLNKTYQKTPTLQRMKSFGSTYNDNNNTFGGRSSSFRLNRNEKKPSPKLNTTFTKCSKENISTIDKTTFNRNSALNRSFSSYTTSSYSTPKPKDKIPKISTSMYHSFQRTTIKQPVKMDKIKKTDNKKDFVNLDAILTDDNSSIADSNYIDPRLINEKDNLPITVNTILNNPDMISSMESLLNTENLPAKFDSFNSNSENNNYEFNTNSFNKSQNIIGNLNEPNPPTVDDLSAQYDKIMSSLEQSIASKASVRDDDSLCEDFDLEEFMTSFDEELHKQKNTENKRTCSSTTRIVKHSIMEQNDSDVVIDTNSIDSSLKVINDKDNDKIQFNKSISLNFSNNNNASDTLFPSSMKRSNSFLDSIQKKNVQNGVNGKQNQRNCKVDQLEQDIMRSLKDLDKFYEPEKIDNQSNKEMSYNNQGHNGNNTIKQETRGKKVKRQGEDLSNGNLARNGKQSSDSAYSSLHRISPSKLSVSTSNPSNGLASLEQIPAGSDSGGGSHKENELRSVSSEEFLAMERSTEIDAPLRQASVEPVTDFAKDVETYKSEVKRTNSRASSRRSPLWRSRHDLSSSESECSAPAPPAPPAPPAAAPRLSRFCHECGNRFPVDTAKFCIECGVKRLVV